MEKVRGHQPRSARRKGTRTEREIQEFLDSRGIPNLRVAGSGSRREAFCDLVTWMPPRAVPGDGKVSEHHQTVFLEVKYRAEGGRIYVPDDLVRTAEKVGAAWIIAVRMKGSHDFWVYDHQTWLADNRPGSFLIERAACGRFKTLSGYFDAGQVSQPAGPPEEEIKVPEEDKEPVARSQAEPRNHTNEYGIHHATSERILLKQAIARAGLIDPEQTIRILREAHRALREEMARRGEEIARLAGRLMRQDLRTTLMERDIRDAVKVIERESKLPV